MKQVINGLSVFTEGSESDKQIIFVHGFPFDHAMWGIQINELRKSHYCISYDIRGLGESAVDDGQFTLERFVDDLEKIIDELKDQTQIYKVSDHYSEENDRVEVVGQVLTHEIVIE